MMRRGISEDYIKRLSAIFALISFKLCKNGGCFLLISIIFCIFAKF